MAKSKDTSDAALDIAGMSDEDFLKLDPSTFPVAEKEKEDIKTGDGTTTDGEEDNTDSEKDNSEDESGSVGDDAAETEDEEEEEEDKESSEEDNEDEDAEESAGSKESEGTEDDAAGVGDDEGEKEKKKEKKEETLSAEDKSFAEIGRKLMSDFVANGKTMRVKSAEDAIRLMQMGANYHKKMRGLKPSLKTLKLLENNGLLDTEKINFLIDLSQKKPEAIKKLLKDSKIDPVDLDLDEESKYVPSQRTVSDTEVDLDEVLESISGTKSYNRTLTVLGDEWDQASREAISKEPTAIRVINAHMENGIFDQVVKEVEYQKSLGHLAGVSDFQAYQQVGAYMHEHKLLKGASDKSETSDATEKHQDAKPSQKQDTDAQRAARKLQKKAASSSRQRKTPEKGDSKYNPLEMSDEEFIKINKLNI